MKIAIVGSRNFKNTGSITQTLARLSLGPNGYDPRSNIMIISGGAAGVDTTAINTAGRLGFAVQVYRPDMSAGYDVKQYHLRNDRIIAEADKVIAFWDGESKGTESVILKCLQRQRDIEVIFDETVKLQNGE